MVTSHHVTITQNLYFQLGMGLSANTFLLLFRIFILHLDHRVKPTDLVICHLAFVHITLLLILLFLLCPDLFEALGFQDDFKCKAFAFIYRVMRGLSICTSCILTLIQAITISPSTSWLARFKQNILSFIAYSVFFFWFLNLSICIEFIFYTVSFNEAGIHFLNISKFCSFSPKLFNGLFLLTTVFRDIFVVGVMLLSSAYMVMLLLRHQKRSQHLSTSLSPRVSIEKRATLIILVLVSFFAVTYWRDIIISFYLFMLRIYHPITVVAQSFVVNVYAIISPLLLISTDRRIIVMMKKMQMRCCTF